LAGSPSEMMDWGLDLCSWALESLFEFVCA
jgi:hypothetical protein